MSDEIAYWTCGDGESLSYETLDEVVEGHLDGLDVDYWPDVLEVQGYRREVIGEEEINALIFGVLELVYEELDNDYGDPEERAPENPKDVEAAQRFVREVVSRFHVWRCSPTGNPLSVNVADFVTENCGAWLEDPKIAAWCAARQTASRGDS